MANYLVDVTVRGAIDPRTGMVCDLSALQRLVDDLVVEPFDHTFLNKDVPSSLNAFPRQRTSPCTLPIASPPR